MPRASVQPTPVSRRLFGQNYAFVVVGVVIMSVLTAALTTAQIVRTELMQGNFERIMISPLGPIGGVVALAAFPVLYSTAFAGVMLLLAVALYGVPLHAAGIPLALVVGALGALAFTCIGLMFVSALLAFKSSVGAEVRFFMPVLNVPFRLIFAMNPSRGGVLDNNLQPEKKWKFRFAVGSTF